MTPGGSPRRAATAPSGTLAGGAAVARTDELLAAARRHDPDRTLCALLAPQAARAELLALILLNHELARVAESVRQPLAGLLRHRFWRDRLADAAAGRPVELAVARALARPLGDGRLTLAELEALIAAREAELDGLLEPGVAPSSPPPGLEALESWLRTTSGGLASAMAGVLGAPPELRAAAEEAGTAFGLVGIVRATLVEARRDRRLLGRSLVDMAGLEPAALRAAEPPPRLLELTDALVLRAERAVAEARRLAGRAPRAWIAPILLATIARERARELRRAGLDPRRAAERPGPPLLPVRLLLAWLRRRP